MGHSIFYPGHLISVERLEISSWSLEKGRWLYFPASDQDEIFNDPLLVLRISSDQDEISSDPLAILSSSCNDTHILHSSFKVCSTICQNQDHFSTDEYHVFQPTLANLKALLIKIHRRSLKTRISRTRFMEDLMRRADQVLVPIICMLSNSLDMVAMDGSGGYTKITEAVIEVPNWTTEGEKWVILVREGVYKENVEVRREKINIMMMGEGMEKIVIIGSRNIVDGFSIFKSSTLCEFLSLCFILLDGFIACNLAVVNTTDRTKHHDTLYTHSIRQFYRDCHIYDTVDFIFDNVAAVFQNYQFFPCRSMPKGKNMITAHGKFEPHRIRDLSFIIVPFKLLLT
ncbi:hypothetical protein AMTRI_Chr07g28040 [Amborella trichopoda]